MDDDGRQRGVRGVIDEVAQNNTGTTMQRRLSIAAFAALTALAAGSAAAASEAEVSKTYADIALAGYEDALTTARALDAAVDALIAAPTEETLEAARERLDRRPRALPADRGLPLRQPDRRRLGGPGERLAARRGPDRLCRRRLWHRERRQRRSTPLNVIANPKIDHRRRDGRRDEDHARRSCRTTLQEAGDIEANVATGYHAIEFLLWGQDLNGTGPGAGNRPATDFDTANCTGGNCDRRAAYLAAATDLLVADLEEMVAQLGRRRRGARTALPSDTERRPASPSSPAWARCPMASWPASA